MTGNATHSGTPCFISWVCVSSLYGLGFVLLFHGTFIFVLWYLFVSGSSSSSNIASDQSTHCCLLYHILDPLRVITSVDVVSVFVFFTFASSCLQKGSCLIYVSCLFAHSGVQHIFCFICLRLVYPVLPVSLDCPFSIAPSVFSNVYLRLSYIMKVFMLLWLGRIDDNHQNKILNH